MRIHPVILCGGAGTRLWPLSRADRPKQFQPLIEDRTLLQATAARFVDPDLFEAPLLVANTEHRFLVAEQLRAVGITPSAILLEPCARNSGPAAAAAASHLASGDPDTLMLLLAADHAMSHPDRLIRAVRQAIPAAAGGWIVTFGTRPRRPETAYGYILPGANEAAVPGTVPGVVAVERFLEKPDPETAAALLADGRYLWNTGNFLVKASALAGLFARFAPDLARACEEAVAAARRDLDFLRLDAASFARAPAISIDHAVIEKTDRAAVVPVEPGWSDIGAFDALADVLGRDRDGNATRGDVLLLDTADSLVISTGPLVAALGLRGAVVAATPDAVLAVSADRAQDVRAMVRELQARGRKESDGHREVHRPWGCYRTLDTGPGFEVKHIRIAPGGRLSLQRHRHRAEHWVVIAGTVRVTRGAAIDTLETVELSRDQSIDIPLGWVHRLENPTDAPAAIVEVQSGSILSPDDIERLDDVYGRG